MKYYELISKFDNYNKEKSALIYLMTEICGINKAYLYANLQENIDENKLKLIEVAVDDYINKNVPVQYIIGYTYFYGLKIKVNPNVLIPRFETEELVNKVVEISKTYNNPKIVDVGTGSGCIAISLAKNIPGAIITAVDISNDALDVAKENARLNNVSIEFISSDLLTSVSGMFDIIVSNPPYIDIEEDVMDLVYDNEPHLALFSQEKGLYHYRQILIQSRKYLNDNGVILFEIAYNKKQEMIDLAKKHYQNIEVIKDIYNNNRIMVIR